MLSREPRSTDNPDAASGPARDDRPSWVERLLRVPLFWKLLVAHLAVVALAVLAAFWLSTRFLPGHPTWMVATVSASAGLLLSTLLTAVVLRLALAPLSQLERAAREALHEEQTPAHLRLHPVADEELAAVVELINELLGRAVEHRRQLRELAVRAIGSAEAERRRVGLLLQDRVAQQIAAALIQLRLVSSGDEGADAEAERERARQSLIEALEEVRRTARALRPPELEELGLERAVAALVRETRDASGCAIRSDVGAADGRLSHPAALALFRILQEALFGLARVSGGGEIRVSLRPEEGAVVGEVAAGAACPSLAASLDPEAEGPGLGLLEMRERARFVGGTVTVEELPGGASRLRVTVPTRETAP